MTIASIFFSIALIGLVGLYVSRPLLQPRLFRRRRRSRYERLAAQKEDLLYQIQNLDFDYETGKIAGTDYQQQRQALISETKLVLMQLDDIESTANDLIKEPGSTTDLRPAADVDQDIEKAVAAMRSQRSPSDGSPEPQELIAAHSRSKNGERSFCTECGKPIDEGDKFCTHCGHAVKQSQEA